ncbi:MAG: ATP-binding cassette domain-containing protein [Ignavibacteria bacterium]|nr:ATP-binding cassette domain-containing protein [Ignavibacteria bacterium]
MINLKNINLSSIDHKIIENLSIEFESKQLIGILSDDYEFIQYMFRMISGIIPPDDGGVYLNNVDIFNAPTNEIRNLRKQISYVFHSGGLISNLSLLENFILPLDYFYPDLSKVKKYEKIFSLMVEFGLEEKILNERPAVLTSSQKKLVLFVRAFLIEPSVIIYNNPFDFLNIRQKEFIEQKILSYQKEKSVTQIFYNPIDKSLYDSANICYVISDDKSIIQGSWKILIKEESPAIRNIIRNIAGEVI